MRKSLVSFITKNVLILNIKYLIFMGLILLIIGISYEIIGLKNETDQQLNLISNTLLTKALEINMNAKEIADYTSSFIQDDSSDNNINSNLPLIKRNYFSFVSTHSHEYVAVGTKIGEKFDFFLFKDSDNIDNTLRNKLTAVMRDVLLRDKASGDKLEGIEINGILYFIATAHRYSFNFHSRSIPIIKTIIIGLPTTIEDILIKSSYNLLSYGYESNITFTPENRTEGLLLNFKKMSPLSFNASLPIKFIKTNDNKNFVLSLSVKKMNFIFFVILKIIIIVIMLMLVILIIKKRLDNTLKKALFPLVQIKDDMEKIIYSNFEYKMKVNGFCEIFTVRESIESMRKSMLNYLEENKRLSKLAAIGQTTRMLAHDVRKPFSSIKSVLNMLDVLKDDPIKLAIAKNDIEKSIKNVESMISDIMDFSRDVNLDTSPQSITTVLDFSIRQTCLLIKDVDINFHYNILNKMKPLIDEERFSRVLSNIIGNAIEAIHIIGNSKTGNIWFKTQDINNFCEIIIGNDGPQFKEKDILNIFESFFTKGKNKGTGLGLASVQKIVHLHKGTVNAQNVLGGVEFIIRIPSSSHKETVEIDIFPKNTKEVISKLGVDDELYVEEKIHSLKPSKVLLLEDEALYRASVRNTIKNNTRLNSLLTLYEVNNVDDALKVAEQELIELAIVDIDLGDIKTGFDFLYEAKKRFPNIKSMVHSNRCVEEDKNLAKELGAIDFVPKPLELFNIVNLLSSTNNEININSSPSDFLDFIYIDDDPILRMAWESSAKRKNIKLITLSSLKDFEKYKNRICRERTFIYLDSDLGKNEQRGEEFADILYAEGYKKIYLATGYEPDNFINRPWLIVIGKECPF